MLPRSGDPKVYSHPDIYKPEGYPCATKLTRSPQNRIGYRQRPCVDRFIAEGSILITVAQTLVVFQICHAKDVEENEINVKLDNIPGLVNLLKKLEFRIVPRVPRHADLICRIKIQQDFEDTI